MKQRIETLDTNQQTPNWVPLRDQQIDKTLTRLTRKKEREISITKMKNKRGNININNIEIKKEK